MRSKGYDYITHANRYFHPPTFKAALRAIEQGLLPPEAYLYWASSVKPLYEEPFDTYEIDRILARKDNDLTTILLIISILQKLIVSKDSETALFAAESLNRIEVKFSSRIEELRNGIEANPEELSYHRQLGKTYYEFSQISSGRETIRNFYLKEAFDQMKLLQTKTSSLQKADYVLLTRVLIELNIYSQSIETVNKALSLYKDDPDLWLLWAESAFYLNKIDLVLQVCRKLSRMTLYPETRAVVDFWGRKL
jgi:tetratricopeptide (TPR) repeat protein